MRRILQLRTPEDRSGDDPQRPGRKSDSSSAEVARIRFRDPQIEMAHGAGGKASRKLVEGLFAPLLFGSAPDLLGDAAHVDINGTRNDLAVSGARAEALVVTYVLEAGLPTPVLEAEVRAMAKAAREAGVRI